MRFVPESHISNVHTITDPTQILNVHQDICSLYSYLEKLQDNVTVRNHNAWIPIHIDCMQNEWPTMKGIGLLQVKNHALLSYTKMELFFMLLKVLSTSPTISIPHQRRHCSYNSQNKSKIIPSSRSLCVIVRYSSAFGTQMSEALFKYYLT